MAHTPTPPGGPPRDKRASVAPMQPMDDYGDFEGDPTSINQMQHVQGNPQGTPRPAPSTSQPMQYAAGSPQLSHLGPPQQMYGGANPQHYATNPNINAGLPGMNPGMTEFGPPMTQISGVI